MQQTQNYNLNKPDRTDYAKIEALNVNADIIDAKLRELEDNGDLTGIQQSISDIDNKVTMHLEEIASTTKLGHVKIGQGLTISEDGTLNAEAQAVPNASTTVAGITKLNDSITSTSTTESATPNAVKKVNDTKLNKAGDTMTGDLVIHKGIPRLVLKPVVSPVDDTKRFDVFYNANGANNFGVAINKDNKGVMIINSNEDVQFWHPLDGWFSIQNLKSSVSNGKSAIASAISDGGVYTSPIASFADMANNIRQLASSGYKMATGSSPNVQIVLDVPANTFGLKLYSLEH